MSLYKYFSSLLASPIAKQEDYIRQLKRIKPKYILYDSSGTNFELTYKLEPPEIFDRLELVNFYIISNYELHKKFDGYEIFKKK